ncbi:RNA 2',3'-cyclic phosphodiesterase [Candidatus Woesearchaeota archaeon]|nr:RNA 2',3'-cyclic phosphodiesterase [Candidatus Woesearchaeota archaeon]|tara:strand:- start:3218 stop:3757 length:540 start_codon:yes stop_codon:yes gene_type:complete
MRLFIAIEMPESIKEYLIQIQKQIDNDLAKIRWMKKEQMHLTLKFLGEVQPNDVEKVKEELRKIKFVFFSVHLNSIGVFPSENCIRVVWVGLKPEDKIMELQKDIDENLKKLFKKEGNFKAHITLGRVKFIDDKVKFMEMVKKIKVESKKINIDCFKLIKSTLTGQYPVYEEVEIFSAS